ncbi:MAG TPA: ABC-F type ribosomal protection protein [Bacillota bacterium]|jgi:ATP-binding cassette subfamily F protein 3|nr:ABC-F type ribosomal protection protein [Bacillota bacterium]HQI15353.1 ABC-F type ribosomal protection protein [Bacillota bacterium]HQJ36415.1 ABC-F type ribosomal protection protein [Bacillota bacterium]HQL35461.1 ABC-F type ribosomal protection protein [Bacillota bacterium]
MIILSCKNINKSYGIDVILEDVTFTVQENEKVGIVGVNGSGKSTLLKIIAGDIEKESGEIFIGRNISIGYMSQDFSFESNSTVYDELLTVFARLIQMEKDLRSLEIRISSLGSSADKEIAEPLLRSYANLQEEYKNSNGFGYRSQIKGVLKGLGFSEEDYGKPVSLLSGGQKTRIALGKILLQNFNILLLDEPTNYLDIESVEWLEEYLKNLKCTALIVSHDRYFLDMVTDRTFEIENKTLKEYDGNYSKFIERKQQLREMQLKDYAEQQKEIARQEAIIARFRQYNREKSIKQAESREKALNRIERIEKPDAPVKNIGLKFEPSVRSGNDVLTVENLEKSFDALLFRNVSFDIKRGEKAALLGPNGIGKTTILKIITGALKADSGYVRLGANVNAGFYDQEQESLNYSNTVIDEIWDEYPHLNQTELRTKLAAFLFQGEDVFKEISKLSGGERSRVALLKLMLSKTNFLLMDEPTNHLDIISKEVLENALMNYSGTVLLVSHDRYFLNKVATRIIELRQEGCLQYNGNYSYYLSKKKQMEISTAGREAEDSETATVNKNDWLKQKEEKSNLRRQQKRLEAVEAEIEQCEKRIAEIDDLMKLPEVFTDHIKCQELHDEQDRLKKKLDSLYEEWSELSE